MKSKLMDFLIVWFFIISISNAYSMDIHSFDTTKYDLKIIVKPISFNTFAITLIDKKKAHVEIDESTFTAHDYIDTIYIDLGATKKEKVVTFNNELHDWEKPERKAMLPPTIKVFGRPSGDLKLIRLLPAVIGYSNKTCYQPIALGIPNNNDDNASIKAIYISQGNVIVSETLEDLKKKIQHY